MNLRACAVLPTLLLCVTTAALAQPDIQSVLNAASRRATLAPGTWSIISGSGLAPGEASASSGPATTLNGVSLTVGGVAAPILRIAPSEISALIPFEAAAPRLGEQATLPVVVTTPDGASTPFNVKLSRVAPGVYTKSSDGKGEALAWDTDGNPISAVGDGELTLWATGLGPTIPAASSTSAEPSSGGPSRLADPVFAIVGDVAINVTFGGFAPGMPGVYQLKVTPSTPISNRFYLVTDGVESNLATLPIPVGLNVANASGSIDGLYPATGAAAGSFDGRATSGPVTFSEMLLAATFEVAFDVLPEAKPFSVIARSGAGFAFIVRSSAVIDIDPANQTWKATSTVPAVPTRRYDFSSSGMTVIDFLTRAPFPGNIVPLSRLDPIAVKAVNSLPVPNSDLGRSPNATFVASGDLPSDGHFVINSETLRHISNFGGFTQIQSLALQSATASFQLFVDGLLVGSKDVMYQVQ